MRPGRKEGGCKDGLGGQDEGKEAGEDQEAGARYSTLCLYWQDLKILLEVSQTREQAWELPKPNSGCGCAVNAKCAGGLGVFPSKAASCRGCTQPRDGSNNSSTPLQLSQLSTSTFPLLSFPVSLGWPARSPGQQPATDTERESSGAWGFPRLPAPSPPACPEPGRAARGDQTCPAKSQIQVMQIPAFLRALIPTQGL